MKVEEDAKSVGISLYCYDYLNPLGLESQKKYSSYDGLALKFCNERTGNIVITKHDNSTTFDHKQQVGAILHVTYNKLGMLLVYISPSTSGDSGAVNNPLNIYTTYDPADITEKNMRKWVKQLFLYHRSTGVLHHNSKFDKFRCCLLKLKGSYNSYLYPDEKFKRITGFYIPLFALAISIASLLIALYSFVFTMK